ncbi:MAG: cysteine hydrolase [Deltaproteobacteria bacterium]|nr:cysteine hydrolase [Deltaproteobacteria bacterium]MBW1952146.1 cysteine hydrolase [Deltaproteobacteria bacterium]MBW1986165.1 cysteine hydrolase [Deltaproteobacteria bacterium]MBW2134919.1 cysteine hydrolase [Deltaproteobacteria bacterium]
MGKPALIVTDMLRDFLDPDGALFVGEAGLQIIPFVAQKIAEMRAKGALVIFLCDSHDPDDREFARFPPHCVRHTPGAEIIPQLNPQPGDYRVEKSRFSGFYNTELEEILKREQITEVHLIGVCTSICVMETARDLVDRDYPVVVHRPGVADLNPQDHEWALKRMAKILGVQVV